MRFHKKEAVLLHGNGTVLFLRKSLKKLQAVSTMEE